MKLLVAISLGLGGDETWISGSPAWLCLLLQTPRSQAVKLQWFWFLFSRRINADHDADMCFKALEEMVDCPLFIFFFPFSLSLY